MGQQAPMAFLSLLLLATSVAQAPQGVALQAPVPEHSVERVLELMGTTLRIELQAPSRLQALAASELAIGAMERVEQSLSTWRTDSELSALAATPTGEWFELSPQVGATLQRAFFWAAETEGAFDPSVAPVVRAWDLRGAGRVPSAAERELALADCGVQHFRLQLPQRMARTRENAGLEEGGFGKGAALDAAREALLGSQVQRAMFDLGGQVLFFGEQALEESTPPLAIAHPDRRQQPLALLQVSSGSCATSGNSERGLQVEGERIGHLLDPRSATPALDFGSVTVWCPSALDADCLSTALYVLGPDAGLRFVEAHEQLEAVYAVRQGETITLRASLGLRPYLSTVDAGVPIDWHSPPSQVSDTSESTHTSPIQ
mgnify:CR=1 FL=1